MIDLKIELLYSLNESIEALKRVAEISKALDLPDEELDVAIQILQFYMNSIEDVFMGKELNQSEIIKKVT